MDISILTMIHNNFDDVFRRVCYNNDVYNTVTNMVSKAGGNTT